MSSVRISSRLAKHEQKKVLRQTILMGLGAVVLGVGFIFFVLPNSVRLISYLMGDDQVNTEVSTIPLQAPLLSAPPVATTSAQIAIAGFAQPETEVVLVLNGSQSGRQKTDAEGTFAITIDLNEGENTVAAYTIAADDRESELSHQYSVIKDTQAPLLEISQPQDNQTIELRKNQNIAVAGKTDAGAQITLNGRLVYTQADGGFSTNYLLQEGENKLELLAKDEAGNETKKELKVTFRL